MLASVSVAALPVSADRAATVASRFWTAQGAKGALVERPTEFAHLHLYVGSEGGFVLVGGDGAGDEILELAPHGSR